MTLSNYLKAQLSDFVDTYKKYYTRTLGATIVYTLLSMAAICLLLYFSNFDNITHKKQVSLLSYFFFKYSFGGTYSLVDLSKAFFFFFFSLFSISLYRLSTSKQGTESLNFSDFLRQITTKDLGFLLLTLIGFSILDYILFKVDFPGSRNTSNNPLLNWIHYILGILRIFIPMILFSLVNKYLITDKKIHLPFQEFLYLLITLWLFNAFSYEFFLIIRFAFFELIMLSFPDESHYFIETILGMPLIALYFLGFHCAMTRSMILLNEKKETMIPTEKLPE